jgi:hypothetical protein
MELILAALDRRIAAARQELARAEAQAHPDDWTVAFCTGRATGLESLRARDRVADRGPRGPAAGVITEEPAMDNETAVEKVLLIVAALVIIAAGACLTLRYGA